MNRWTSEQDKRQLETWSDKHPYWAGLCTCLAIAPYFLMLVCGILVYLLWTSRWGLLVISFAALTASVVTCPMRTNFSNDAWSWVGLTSLVVFLAALYRAMASSK